MGEIRTLAAKDGSHVFSSSLPFSKTFVRAVQEQTPAFKTKYARTELKGSIADIVKEMKAQISKLESE